MPKVTILRYCRLCAAEDANQWGEPYWRRVHQCPGVLVCPRHAIWLVSSPVDLSRRTHRHAYVPLASIAPSTQREPCDDAKLLRLAEQVAHLVALALESQGGAWRRHYIDAAIQRDLAWASGRIRQRDMENELRAFYTVPLLRQLGCDWPMGTPEPWVMKLFHASSTSMHPLYHLLLQQFLGLEPDSPIAGDWTRKPFGAPPWPCLNPASTHYKKGTIGVVELRVTGNHVSGIFGCACGFTYQRTGPDKTPEDRFRRDRLVAVGPVWRQTLVELSADESTSLRQCARTLGVDARTIQRYRAEECERVSDSSSPPTPIETTRQRYRKRWRDALENATNATAARRCAPAVYAWLYRHDWAWLMQQNSPRCKVMSVKPVSWEARDVELVDRIPEAVVAVKEKDHPYVRVTRTSIGRELGHLSWIQKHAAQLPRTMTMIAEETEDTKAFQERRVMTTMRRCGQAGEALRPWEVMRRANIPYRQWPEWLRA